MPDTLRPPIQLSVPDSQTLVAIASSRTGQRLLPFVHARCRDQPSDAPAALLQRIKLSHRATTIRNSLMHRELVTLLAAFRGGGVPVIPLKGPLLALRLYGDLGERPMGDLDLLVRPEQVTRASALLAEAGYEAGRPLEQYDTPFSRRAEDESRFVYRVELHHDLLPSWFSTEGLAADCWRRAVDDPREEVRAWRLHAADELLFLCLHLAKHVLEDPSGTPDLLPALDVHLLAREHASEEVWHELLRRSKRFNVRGYVSLALAFSSYWFGDGTPTVSARGAAERLASWKRTYFERLDWTGRLSRAAGGMPQWKQLHQLAGMLVADEGVRDRFAHLRWATTNVWQKPWRTIRTGRTPAHRGR